MIIKKYLAKTEREAIEMARKDLGNDAIVMNMKKVHPKGLSKLFVRKKVEVTAALEENVSYETKDEKKPVVNSYQPDIIVDKETEVIEEKLNHLQQLLEKQMSSSEAKEDKKQEKPQQNQEPKKEEGTTDTPDLMVERSKACRELILKQLIENEVDEEIAKRLMDEIDRSLPKDAAVDHVLASIYQKIILMLGQPYPIESMEEGTKFVFFLGSTGVGKTTTIAKIASQLKLGRKQNIALVTADTYRIAAVDQLKTYANILGVPLKVVYTPEELAQNVEELRKYDICLVDTAGRSHRNKEQLDDIHALLDQVPIHERQVYLVLNASTKYADLKEIADVYLSLTDYSMIFTKLDETSCNGVMLNMRVNTQRPLSYVTWGQNVPDDIGEIDAQKIAKKLLGGRS